MVDMQRKYLLRQRALDYYYNNREKVLEKAKNRYYSDPQKHLDRVRFRKFGITREEYVNLFKLQGGLCAICRLARTGKHGNLVVDHCHRTGRVRGLLCNYCNTGIGQLMDSPDLLEKAAQYLRTNRIFVIPNRSVNGKQ